MQVVDRNNRIVVDLEVEGVCPRDYPDFCDAFFAYGVYADTGEILTNDELDQLTEDNGDVINMMAHGCYSDHGDAVYENMRDAEFA